MLGPLLFIIYVNDLPDLCHNLCNLYLFADDAKLFNTINDNLDSERLNVCFKNVIDWSQNWLMKLNIKKCKVLSLHGIRQEPVSYNYGLDNLSLLERVNSMKDLGVTISCNLSFRNHIYEKINTAYKMLGIIKCNFNAVDTFTFITVYKVLYVVNLNMRTPFGILVQVVLYMTLKRYRNEQPSTSKLVRIYLINIDLYTYNCLH